MSKNFFVSALYDRAGMYDAEAAAFALCGPWSVMRMTLQRTSGRPTLSPSVCHKHGEPHIQPLRCGLLKESDVERQETVTFKYLK